MHVIGNFQCFSNVRLEFLHDWFPTDPVIPGSPAKVSVAAITVISDKSKRIHAGVAYEQLVSWFFTNRENPTAIDESHEGVGMRIDDSAKCCNLAIGHSDK
jgi:hypothetical protein